MSTAGKDVLVQVNGTSGTWNEVDARDAPPELDKNELDVTTFGDEGQSRIAGLSDASVSLEVIYDDTSPTAQSDLIDSLENDTAIDVEISLDRNAGSPIVVAFTGEVFSMSPDVTVDGEVTLTFEVMNNDGNQFQIKSALS